MKKIIVLLITVTLLMTSCSSQEKMTPMIFIHRLKENYPEINVSDDGLYRENDSFFCFLTDNDNQTYAMKIYCDTRNNIKKICLACNNTNKADNVKYVSEAIIKTYVPNENGAQVIKNIFLNEMDYYNTQWYRYSSVTDDGTVFFSVENLKISTATDAELTLKQNDIIFR